MPRRIFFLLTIVLFVTSSVSVSIADDPDPEPPKKAIMLEAILKKYPKNEDAIRQVYLLRLNRNPSVEEFARLLKFLSVQPNKMRLDSFKDIDWALLNCTEYLNKLKELKQRDQSK